MQAGYPGAAQASRWLKPCIGITSVLYWYNGGAAGLLRHGPQKPFARRWNRRDFKPGENVQGIHLPIHHRMITDPSAHKQIRPEQRRHTKHGLLGIGLAKPELLGEFYNRRRLDPRPPAPRRQMPCGQHGKRIVVIFGIGALEGGTSKEHFNPVSSTYRVMAAQATRTISGSRASGCTQKRPISTIGPSKVESADNS